VAQESIGWPLFEMSLQAGTAQVVLPGTPRSDEPGKRARAWCSVLEIVEKFGISASFEPLTLYDRRGG